MIISQEQKHNLVDEMEQVLIERHYTHNYTRDALNKIIDRWAEQKSDLIDVLSKHPKWNQDKLMIQFDENYTRRFERLGIVKFVNWLRRYGIPYSCSDMEPEGWPLYFIYNNIEDQFFSSDMDYEIRWINRGYPEFKLRNNMKSSKAIGLISRKMGWDQLEGFNKVYSELCDCINPIDIKRHTCLSVNPIDFLLMSNGDTWTSCHRIGYLINVPDGKRDPGCYSSGTISYMLDDVSFVFYTVDASFDEDNIEQAPKACRQVFAYQNKAMLQSRLYPQSNDSGAEHIYTQIREIVQRIVAECLDEPNLWETKREANHWVLTNPDATLYSDWDNFSVCRFSLLKTSPLLTDYGRIKIGAAPMSIANGEEHGACGTIIGNVPVHYVCSKCGQIHTDTVFINGDTYCRECVWYCEYCGEYHFTSEIPRFEYVSPGCWDDMPTPHQTCNSDGLSYRPLRPCGHRCSCGQNYCRRCEFYNLPDTDVEDNDPQVDWLDAI